MRPTRRTSALVSAITALTLLVGCGSDSPEPAANDSSSEGPSGDAPPMPEQAKGDSEEGAKAFAGYWVENLNYATTTGDTQQLKTLGTEQCTACTDFASTLEQIYTAGGKVESAGWDVQAATPIAGKPQEMPALQMDVLVSPQKVTEREGAKVQSFKGGPQAMTIFLVRRDDGWLVNRLDIAV